MSRLTDKIINRESGEILAYRLKKDVSTINAYRKLGELEDLEEQGLLLKLKHKIGDIVYYISPFDDVIEERRISMITQKSDKSMKYRLSSEFGAYEVTEKELEKEYYPTLAEAEKALAEMKG